MNKLDRNEFLALLRNLTEQEDAVDDFCLNWAFLQFTFLMKKHTTKPMQTNHESLSSVQTIFSIILCSKAPNILHCCIRCIQMETCL